MNKKPLAVNQVKREKRPRQTADGSTPPRPVNEILVEVLHRKVQKGHSPRQALLTIYGIDIMADKVEECRRRLLGFVSENGYTITRAMIAEVLNHIIVAPVGRKYPSGALDYDFRFAARISEHDEEVDRRMHSITNGNQPRNVRATGDPPLRH